jgi:hypothetical protein
VACLLQGFSQFILCNESLAKLLLSMLVAFLHASGQRLWHVFCTGKYNNDIARNPWQSNYCHCWLLSCVPLASGCGMCLCTRSHNNDFARNPWQSNVLTALVAFMHASGQRFWQCLCTGDHKNDFARISWQSRYCQCWLLSCMPAASDFGMCFARVNTIMTLQGIPGKLVIVIAGCFHACLWPAIVACAYWWSDFRTCTECYFPVVLFVTVVCGWVLGIAYDELIAADDEHQIDEKTRTSWRRIWSSFMDREHILSQAEDDVELPYTPALIKALKKVHITFWDKPSALSERLGHIGRSLVSEACVGFS